MEGDLSGMRSIYAKHPEVLNLTNSNGDTALVCAAWKQKWDCVRWLVEQGAAINHINKNGKTALSFAAVGGSVEMVEFLLDNGAEVNGTNKDGYTALYFAASERYPKMPVIEALVKRGANVNQATTKEGKTPLYAAVEKSSLNLVRYLVVDCKADVNATTTDPLSPSPLYAAMLKQKKFSSAVYFAEVLLEHGADATVVDKYKKSLLHLYADGRGRDTAVVDTLVAKGCDVNAAAVDGKTCLSLALAQNVLPLAEHLLKKGAIPSAADEERLNVLRRGVTAAAAYVLYIDAKSSGAKMKLSAIEYRSVHVFGLPAGTVEAVFRAAVTEPSIHEAVEAMIRGDGGAKAKALVADYSYFYDLLFAAKRKTGLSLPTMKALLRAILLTDLEELEALAAADAAADAPRLSSS